MKQRHLIFTALLLILPLISSDAFADNVNDAYKDVSNFANQTKGVSVTPMTDQQFAETQARIEAQKKKNADAGIKTSSAPAAPTNSVPATPAPAPAVVNNTTQPPVTVSQTNESANTITVSGVVYDDITKETLPGATILVLKSDGQTIINETTTKIDGDYTIDVPVDAKIKASFVGMEPQILDAKSDMRFDLKPAKKNDLKEVDVVKTRTEGETCAPIDAEYEQYAQGEKNERGNMRGQYRNGKCVPTACITGYKLNNYACEAIVCDANAGLTLQGNDCVKTDCSQSEIAKFENATGGKMENGQCIPICATDYGLNEKNKCVKNECTEQQKSDLFATAGIIENGKCIPTACVGDYKLKDGQCSQKSCPAKELEKLRATAGIIKNGQCVPTACITDYKLENGACVNADILAEKQKAYDEAHEKEQSFANRTLTALTTAATGIGGMELARGLAEQSADKDAAADMAAYIATFRCNYGDGKQFTAGPDEIELPGGNNQEMMNLRAQYLALAADLKERKTALGMKPGIESEEIGDKTQTGLYDDESIGITGGNYASLYRATALGSESDQAQIDDAAAASKRRVIGGAVAAGAGVVGGFVGNELINGELGKKLKEKNQGKALRAATEIEKDALDDMKKCLKNAGVTDTDSLEFQNFYVSVLSVKNINCKREITEIATKAPSNVAAKTIFADSNDANTIYDQLIKSFGPTIAGKMIGVTLSQTPTESQKQNAINTLKSGLDKVTKRFQDAAKEDEKSLSSSGLKDFDIDFSSILSSFSGDGASSSIMNVVNNGFK